VKINLGRNGLWVKAIERQTERQKLRAKLDPNLREWIDRVIVPALVREYIAEHKHSDCVADPTKDVRQFKANDRLSAEGIQ
jgi:hypothetical protein